MLLCELLPAPPPPPPPLMLLPLAPALAPDNEAPLPRVSLNVRYRRKVVVVDVGKIIELGELETYRSVSFVVPFPPRPSKESSKSSLFLNNQMN